MKLLAAPKETTKKVSLREIKLIIRAVLGVGFLVLGFNFAHTAFFEQYPLFGVDYLAEVLISAVSGLFGFFTLPRVVIMLKNWIEKVVSDAISAIVDNFWDQQTRRINQAKREKRRKKSLEEKAKKEDESNGRTDCVVVDTSVLIDGRINEIVKSGFLDKILIVPKQVVLELQHVADSKDPLKRQRGRRGLDRLKDLRKLTKVDLVDVKANGKDVDDLLVDLAKKHDIPLLTLDFNLIKVAELADVGVLNVNVLVESLKTIILPGEVVSLKIVQKGKEKSQGVGYLEDGTMLVVKGGAGKVGEEVKVKISKLIQSPAGKMFFCELA
jgi:uncharacterized protein YacL